MTGEIPFAQPPPPPRRTVGWRWRRSRLRRPTDRLQAWIGLGLLLAALSATVATALLAGRAAHQQLRHTADAQARSRHLTPAVLVQDAPVHPEPGSDEEKETRYPVTVRYAGPGGEQRTGQAEVSPGLPSGARVRIWVDGDGSVADPPMTRAHIHRRVLVRALLASAPVPLAAAAVHRLIDRGVQRRNLAAWEKEWAETAPRWTPSH
ncbi:Rv1733c family protein [Streptomyces reniochalinae]|uniref:DUF3592 domain-containing protein n=1 Tax=Streptomyces reniochalinae TaxID=2250578 RepID=A0A367EIV0_9ACTN|nr:DUF3592 domain-containing protein [Streptomyces reniochalinae]RCG17565.1 hypothetical protein DQ392_17035 [Streptomyces reniochalinae]